MSVNRKPADKKVLTQEVKREEPLSKNNQMNELLENVDADQRLRHL